MLIYRGALVYAEDRNHDDRAGLSPPELEYLKHVVFKGYDVTPEDHQAQKHQLPNGMDPKITVTPVVNHGRWLIPCPGCFSAAMASRNDHRFYCVECRNAGAQGKWMRVTWPPAKDEIEALLIMRPDPRTRNWTTETVAELLAENEAHSVL